MTVSKDKLNKLINRAKELHGEVYDFRYHNECYDDNFITSLLGVSKEECMQICIDNNITNDNEILNFIATKIFNE